MNTQLPALEWQVCDEQRLDNQAWQSVLKPPGEYNGETGQGERVGGTSRLSQRCLEVVVLTIFGVILTWWTRWPARTHSPLHEPATPDATQATASLDTFYFRFHFHPQDAEMVQAVAAQLDRQYERLRQEFALGPLSESSKLTIEVRLPITSSTLMLYPTRRDNLLVVPTAVLSATEASGKEAALIRYAEYWLAGRSFDEAVQRAVVDPRWQPMLAGFRQVLRRRRFDDYVMCPEWVYLTLRRHLPTAPPRMPTPVAHKQYEATPVDTYPEESTRDFALRISLADFLITTYGRQRLPDLFNGFSRYDTWEELSPAVFGVTAIELEAGWHTHLEQTLEKAVPLCRY